MSLSKFTATPLSTNELEGLLDKLLSALTQRCHPYRIFLFGSAARGEMTTHSDLDICVLFEDIEALKSGRINYFKERPPIDVPCDILFLTVDEFEVRSARGGLCHLIKSEGKILYQKDEA